MFSNIFILIIGFAFLIIGADILVKGSKNIATKFHIPDILIGLTIVALGTSAPELFITISSAISKNEDLIIGNAIGSNFCNLFFIIGILALFHPIYIDPKVKKIHIPISFFATLLLLLMIIFSNVPYTITRISASILILLFIIYFSYPIFNHFKDIMKTLEKDKKNKSSKKINLALSIFFVILGSVLLKFGGDFVVESSSNISVILGLSEEIIGATVIAFGTALPELVTSIFAIINKNSDLAIGNLVSSCILNLLLILGTGSLILPLHFSYEFIRQLTFLILGTFVLWLINFIGRKNYITRFKGIILLLIFTIYVVSLFV